MVIGAAVVTAKSIKSNSLTPNYYLVILNGFKLGSYVLGLEKLYKLVSPKKPKKIATIRFISIYILSEHLM